MRKLSLIAALSCLATPVLADDFAVLLGVRDYDSFRRVADATDILNATEPLQDAGFAVSGLADPSAREMQRVLTGFAQDALDADRLVVALSGRFATDGARTWFLAEDADTPTPFGLDDAISVDTVLDVLSRAPGQAVLVLGYDQSSFASFGRYLREGVGTLDVPQGVTVVYGDPGRVDDVLTRAIAPEGGDVMAYVRDNGRLNMLGYQPRRLILVPQRGGDAARPAPPAADPSLAAWNIARATNTADSYRDFVFRFPASAFADLARARLDAIESDPQRLAEQAEAALGLSRDARRDIQRDLTTLGFDTRGVDGIFGRGTRSAIRDWQQQNGFGQTSFLTASQINRLDAQASVRTAEIEAEQERTRAEAERLDTDYWEETGARGDAAGLRAYLDRYPEGLFADEARDALESSSGNQQARAAEDALNINPTLRRLIESRLDSLGFDPGPVDGRFDQDTRDAIAAYQGRRGLQASGYIDQPTLARLLADTFGR